MRLSDAVAARLDRLIVYGYYTAKPRSVNPIAYARRYAERRASLRIARDQQMRSMLAELRSKSSSTGCSSIDYLELYNAVRAGRPRCVLECGSGISTAVLALALSRNESEFGISGQVISMEDSPEYHSQIVEIFPSALRRFVAFHVSPVVVRMYRELKGVCYAQLPDLPYDLVFIDGPSQRPVPGAAKLFNADFLEVARSGRAVTGILDQRIATLRALRRLLPQATIRYSPIKQLAAIRVEGPV